MRAQNFLRTCSQSDFSPHGANTHKYTEAAEKPLGVPANWPLLPGILATSWFNCELVWISGLLSEHMYWGARGVTERWPLRLCLPVPCLSLVSFPENTVGPCLVWLWCSGARWARLPQRGHRGGPGQLQPILVEGTPAWGAGSLPCQLCHTSAAVRAQQGPEGCAGAALLTWQRQTRSASSLATRTYAGFCFVLIYWQLIFWNVGMKENPLKKNLFFSSVFHTHEEEGAKVLGCSLRLWWVLPALSPLWLAIDKFLQLILFCGNAPRESQASG